MRDSDYQEVETFVQIVIGRFKQSFDFKQYIMSKLPMIVEKSRAFYQIQPISRLVSRFYTFTYLDWPIIKQLDPDTRWFLVCKDHKMDMETKKIVEIRYSIESRPDVGLEEMILQDRCIAALVKGKESEARDIAHNLSQLEYSTKMVDRLTNRSSKSLEDWEYDIWIRERPPRSIGWFVLGHIHNKNSEYDLAIQCFQKAIEESTNWSEPHSRLGVAHFNLANYTDARDAFRNAFEIEPFRSLAIIGLGMSYLKLQG